MRFPLQLAERDVVKQCCDLLKAHGWKVINHASGLLQRPNGKTRIRVGEVGGADKLCLRPIAPGHTHTFYLEFKQPGGRLSDEQIGWHEYMARLGFLTVTVDSLEGLQAWLRERFLP